MTSLCSCYDREQTCYMTLDLKRGKHLALMIQNVPLMPGPRANASALNFPVVYGAHVALQLQEDEIVASSVCARPNVKILLANVRTRP